jgi:hypothetical protein
VTHDNVAGYVVAALFPPFVLFFVWALVAAIMFVSRGARTDVNTATASGG